MSSDFDVVCERERIIHQVVPTYTPRQNGTTRRMNKAIMSMVISMSKSKHLLNELCGKVVFIATYILNKCWIKRLKRITPEEYLSTSSQAWWLKVI